MGMDVVYYWVGIVTFWLLSSIGGVLLLAIVIGYLLEITREKFDVVKSVFEWAINYHLFKEWKAKNKYRTYDSWFKK